MHWFIPQITRMAKAEPIGSQQLLLFSHVAPEPKNVGVHSTDVPGTLAGVQMKVGQAGLKSTPNKFLKRNLLVNLLLLRGDRVCEKCLGLRLLGMVLELSHVELSRMAHECCASSVCRHQGWKVNDSECKSWHRKPCV